MFDEKNRVVPVTVVKAGPNVVTRIRTPERDGYSAVQLAFGDISPRKVTKPVSGQFTTAGVTPRRHVAELRLETPDAAAEYEVGQELTAEIFADGSYVDVTGTSKGKGFAGTMKRHGFSGQGAAHGAQAVHRRPGSIGGCSTPGRVFKGTRMSGRMGNDRVTTQNLLVHKVDAENGVLLIKGAIPGRTGGLVIVRSAIKRGDKLMAAETERIRRPPIDVKTPAGKIDGSVELPAEIVRRPGQHRADAPGRRRAAGRRPAGHALDQDARRSPRRRPEAVPAEGDRSRPARLDAGAAVRRRWHRARSRSRATTRSARPRR